MSAPPAEREARGLALAAPAKVNLTLRVVGRRPDGYHELESLFAPLDLADRVQVRLEAGGRAAPRVRLELVDPGEAPGGPTPVDATNLAVRAAEGFLEATGCRVAVSIRLAKRIPAAAGLGGGSSDAAAVLRALGRLLPGRMGPGATARLALRLGADVPFFLDPRPGLVRGIGERIEPLEGLPALPLVLANPGLALSTAEVFHAYDALDPALTGPGSASTLDALAGPGGPAELASVLANDLEAAAIRLCPPIARLRDGLQEAGALGVGMTGSGPTVFGVFEDAARARAGLEHFRSLSRGSRVWARLATTVHS